jgi:hypothetical protein
MILMRRWIWPPSLTGTYDQFMGKLRGSPAR